MNSTFDAFLRSWPSAPWVLLGLLLAAAVYLRGWLRLHARDPRRWPASKLVTFLLGLAALFVALASPLEPFAALLLQVHMAQHLLLMMVAPPLLWLGAPLFPLLRGLPGPIRTVWVAPLFRSSVLRRCFRTVAHPAPAWLLFTATTWFWHLPPIYDLALGFDGWHVLQHGCFLGAALAFWYPVIRPFPSRPQWSPWLLVPYLILADVQNTILSAVFTFSDRPLYSYYADRPQLGSLSPLEDQAAAGVLMWVPGSIAFLVPLFWIGIQLLYGERSHRKPHSAIPCPPHFDGRISLPVFSEQPDVLRLPLVGRLLRWRFARLAFQLPLTVIAMLMIYDGLRGPQVSPMNLAGVLPWIHWRGFLILSLLALGNVFCLACPFLVPRTLARRWLPQGRSWPRWLRSKWLAVLLLAGFVWAYEALSLWDSPWWTAWIALGYFVAVFVIDGFFRGAAFCKYLCPIGQFNFVQSLMSPLEVAVRDPRICTACRTKDCIRGRDGVPGCELNLFPPRKASNMDCTFCLDCIHACPHDNLGIQTKAPGRELWHDSLRSGIGRFSKRPDLAALIVVLVFGAFTNAAGMVAPVGEWQHELASLLHLGSPALVTSAFYGVGLVVLPTLLVGTAAVLSRWLGQSVESARGLATRFAYALVPIGFGMWLAHYSFHLLGSFESAIPAVQRFAGDLGLATVGDPEWRCACSRPIGDWLTHLEMLALDLGLLFSLYAGYQIARRESEQIAHALKGFAPWALLIVLLFAAGVWIVLQPMQMRGTF
ncbi:MAG TPA: cytochrome c oxidase assembly protein [Gemmataceae bacterium]|nr:cytochrome c oxidase assembly protein [Gemmataceae bacterium]